MGGGSKKNSAPQYEPLKTAEESMQSASQTTAREQQLRRGIASTFSRSSMGRSAPVPGATSGTAGKLGG